MKIKGKIRLGYSDGSGPDTITIGDKPVLRLRWGCNCCANRAETKHDLTPEEATIASIVVVALNQYRMNVKFWNSIERKRKKK